MWRGKTINVKSLSKTAQAKMRRLSYRGKRGFRFAPVLAEKSGRGYYLFVPSEWGGDEVEFKIAMEQFAKTPGIMKVTK